MAFRGIGKSKFHVRFMTIVVLLMMVQIMINTLLYSGIDESNNNNYHNSKHPMETFQKPDPLLEQIQLLQDQLSFFKRSLSAASHQQHAYIDDGNFYPFLIRDARHLTPTSIVDINFHIFDYIDLFSRNQKTSTHTQLVHNGRIIDKAPCFDYSISCYREKILQVFGYVLTSNPNTQYFFYMESDNDLCISLQELRDWTYSNNRYFVSTGIGFSGWIMSRQCMIDFLNVYSKSEVDARPDVVGKSLLLSKNSWAVTRTVWVSHTILPSRGKESLSLASNNNKKNKKKRRQTIAEEEKNDKVEETIHLPRCLEARSAKIMTTSQQQQISSDENSVLTWDFYFDANACPESDIYPC